MTALSELLRRPEAAILGAPKVAERAFAIDAAHRRVIAKLGAVEPKPPPKVELERLYRKVEKLWAESRSLSELDHRELRCLPWILFGYPQDRHVSVWLGAQPGLVQAFLARIGPTPRASQVSALARAFVRHYPSTLDCFHVLREWLLASIETSSSIRLRKWQERHALAGLFARNGPAFLLPKWMDAGLAWNDFVSAAGFDGDLGRAELLRRALQVGMDAFVRDPMQPSDLQRLLDIFEGSDGRLRFDEDRALLAASLLRPYLQESPPPAIQKVIQHFLTEHLGHPRRQPGRWTGVSDPLQDLFVKWGLAATLESFFNFIDRTAHVPHWSYRRAFWSAYLRRGMVTDAWIILGNAAHELASRHLDRDTLRSGVGRCRDSADPTHSMILMRIGGIVIAEWSHNGKLRAWSPGNRRAPPLYRDEYTASQLRNHDELALTHSSPATGSWQDKAAYFIGRITGTYILDHEYMPRGRGT